MKPLPSIFSLRLPLSFAALLVTFSSSLQAEIYYWDGSVDDNWTDAGNWTTSGPATAPGSADIATFTVSGLTFPRTINLNGDKQVSGISTADLTGLVTLRGGGSTPSILTIGPDGINHLRGGLTIGTTLDDKVNIQLSGSQSWTSSTTGSGTLQALRVNNDISAADAGNKVLTLDGINTGTIISGSISNGAGTVSVTKVGTGTWELQGTNTYTGDTTVGAGTLRLTNRSAASAGSAFTVADNAILSLKTANATETTGFTSAQLSAFLPTIGFNSSAANLGLDTGNGGFTYTGDLTGAYTLNKLAANTLTLSGANTFTGPTVITQGNIAYMNPGALSSNSAITVGAGSYLILYSGAGGFNQAQMDAVRTSATYADNTAAFGINTANGNLSYTDAISGDHGFVKTGANNLTFSGTASNAYTGPTYVAGGTLELNKTGAATAVAGDVRISSGTLKLLANNQIADTSNISVSGGTMDFGGKAETVTSLALTGTGAAQTGTGTATVTVGAITRSGTTSKITINGGARLVAQSVALTGDNIALNAASGGNILLGGGSTTQVTELTIGSGGLSMTGQTIQVNASSGSAKGTRITLGGNFTGSGENLLGVSGTATLADLAMGTGSRTFTINNTGSGSTFVAGNTQIGLNITGEGLTKAGAGTLSLSGNNTYTGVTQVNAGVIRILSNTALGSNAAGTEVAAGGGIRLENNVTVTGETLRLVGVSTGSANPAALVNFSGDNAWTGNVILDVSTSQNVRFSMTGGTLDVRGNVFIDGGVAAANSTGLVLTGDGGTGKISGNITGTGNNQNLIKNGGSTWELSGTNTYNGITRVDAGVLIVNSIANNLGSPTTIANQTINLGEGSNPATATSGTFRYAGTGETTGRGFVLRSGSVGNGVIEQAGTGALIISGAISSVSSTTDKTLTLQGSSAGTGELSGDFSDTAGTSKTSLIKAGSGTWTLSGVAKAYEGTTAVTGGILNVTTSLTQSTALTVDNGTFIVGADNVLKDDASVTLGTGAILSLAGFTDAAGVLAVTGNAQLQLAGGTNSLTFANSSSADWTSGTLAITGWSGLTAGNDQIIFNGNLAGRFSTLAESAGGLTDQQLGHITFVDPAGFAPGTYSAKLDGTLLVPDALIPEPSAVLTFLAGGAGLILRRRVRRDTVATATV